QANCKIADVDHLLHLALPLRHYLARFERYQLSKFAFGVPQRVAELPHDLTTFGRRHLFPTLKSLLRAFNRAIIFNGSCCSNLCQNFTIDRGNAFESFAAAAPATIKDSGIGTQNTELAEHGCLRTFRASSFHPLTKAALPPAQSSAGIHR